MRTKTLLSAVAALAVGVATSMAQTTYSQNVVGYVNISLTNAQFNLICPALDADGTGTNNTIASIVGTNMPTGTAVYAFNSSGGFDQLTYKALHGVTAWYLGTVANNSYALNPGKGFFILPAGNATITQVGTVLQGSLTNNSMSSVGGAFGLVSSQVPVGGGVTTTLNYQPSLNDTIYVYDPVAVGYNQYVYKTLHGVTGWYLGTTVTEPQVGVGQGFWLLPKNSGEVWTNNFIVH